MITGKYLDELVVGIMNEDGECRVCSEYSFLERIHYSKILDLRELLPAVNIGQPVLDREKVITLISAIGVTPAEIKIKF